MLPGATRRVPGAARSFPDWENLANGSPGGPEVWRAVAACGGLWRAVAGSSWPLKKKFRILEDRILEYSSPRGSRIC